MDKQTIRNHLQTIHSDTYLRTWFDPLSIQVTEPHSLNITFPHALFAQWFIQKRRDVFEQDMISLLGEHIHIRYAKPAQRTSATKKNIRIIGGAGASDTSFASFIYNRKNEFPVSMAQEIAKNPKNPTYNPFIICGKGTCGKTHLLHAMAQEIQKHVPEKSVFTGSVDDLAALQAESPRPGAFRRAFLRYRAICVDNAQDLIKHPVLRDELALIADTFKEKKRPFIVAVDDGLMPGTLGEKLCSRLEAGLVVTLKKPDLDIRMRYARAEMFKLRLDLKKEHVLSLAQRFQNFRNLEGILKKIAAFRHKTEKTISSADLEKIIRHADAQSGKPATPEHIITFVADTLAIPKEEILGTSRKASVALARQICMYACRELLGISLTALGARFGGKNHATVLYACKKIGEMQDSNKNVHKILTQVRKKFVSRMA